MNFDPLLLLKYFKKVPLDPVIAFAKQLYFLLNAGVPLYKSLHIVQLQTTQHQLKKILRQLIQNIAEGKTFVESLVAYPETFSPFFLSMVEVGESKGELAESMHRVYLYLESRKEVREKVVTALTYPVILVCTGFMVLLCMIFLVLPKFVEIFTTSNIPLPLPTRILIKISNLFGNHYLFLIIIFGIIVGGYTFFYHYPPTKKQIEKFILKTPFLGDLLLNNQVAVFCRTFGTLYKSGIQLLPALDLSISTLSMNYLKNEMAEVVKSVRDGKGISKPISTSKAFPPLMSQMISIGEETGALEDILLETAEYYEQETAYKVKRLMVMLEPMALIIISLFVTFSASAIMLPLFRMGSVIRSF